MMTGSLNRTGTGQREIKEEVEEEIMNEKALRPIQISAARIWGSGSVENKTELARRIGVTKRTITTWFQSEVFLEKVEEFRKQTEVSVSPEMFLKHATAVDKQKLFKLLEKDSVASEGKIPEVDALLKLIRNTDGETVKGYELLGSLVRELNRLAGIARFGSGDDKYDYDGEYIGGDRFYSDLQKICWCLEASDSANRSKARSQGDTDYSNTPGHQKNKKNIEIMKRTLRCIDKYGEPTDEVYTAMDVMDADVVFQDMGQNSSPGNPGL